MNRFKFTTGIFEGLADLEEIRQSILAHKRNHESLGEINQEGRDND